jgi:hypothetical protein
MMSGKLFINKMGVFSKLIEISTKTDCGLHQLMV